MGISFLNENLEINFVRKIKINYIIVIVNKPLNWFLQRIKLNSQRQYCTSFMIAMYEA